MSNSSPRPGASKARLVITAITLEKRTVAEVVADYGVSKSWVYELLARYRAEGDTALEPRSRRPKTSPNATPAEVIDLVLQLRKDLTDHGLDAGPDTIGWHMTHRHHARVSRATIHRILSRAGTLTPDPRKRPRSSYLRFEAAMPNETWQSDFTHYRLTRPDGPTRRRHRNHHLARRPLPLRPARVCTPTGHRTNRPGDLPTGR